MSRGSGYTSQRQRQDQQSDRGHPSAQHPSSDCGNASNVRHCLQVEVTGQNNGSDERSCQHSAQYRSRAQHIQARGKSHGQPGHASKHQGRHSMQRSPSHSAQADDDHASGSGKTNPWRRHASAQRRTDSDCERKYQPHRHQCPMPKATQGSNRADQSRHGQR